jgi:hypothetical protein
MKSYLKMFERIAIVALIGLLSIVVLLSIGELGWLLWRGIATPPFLLLEIDQINCWSCLVSFC